MTLQDFGAVLRDRPLQYGGLGIAALAIIGLMGTLSYLVHQNHKADAQWRERETAYQMQILETITATKQIEFDRDREFLKQILAALNNPARCPPYVNQDGPQ
ncbi:MAG: hypothetical protein QNJ62_06160 [Methyloceanibacter sp.]|nr:hypothetical protein [Methyloceanibacter sp.]